MQFCDIASDAGFMWWSALGPKFGEGGHFLMVQNLNQVYVR